MSAPPPLSVVIPVYNGERWLTEAVASVRDQSFANFECVVVDDGSTDRTLALLREIEREDHRVRVVSRPNTGIVGALNDGVAAARAPLIARMDADDICLPERFEQQLTFLRDHPDIVAVGCWIDLIDPDGDSLGEQQRPVTHEAIEAWHMQGRGGGIMHPTAVLRTEAVRTIGAYRAAYQWVEDYDLFLRLGEVGRLANLPRALLRYRVHEKSVTHERRALQAELAAKALAEALARRGVEGAHRGVSPGPSVDETDDRRHIHVHWATIALRNGRLSTAHKHAWRGALSAPLFHYAWRTLTLVLDRVQAAPAEARAGVSQRPKAARALARGWFAMLDGPRRARHWLRRTAFRLPLVWRLVPRRHDVTPHADAQPRTDQP